MSLALSLISMFAGSLSRAAPIQQVRISDFHALSVDSAEWNAFQTRMLGNRDFLFEHRKLPSLRGIARTEYQDLKIGQSPEAYLKELCSVRKGSLNASRKDLPICELPHAASDVMQYLTVASPQIHRVAVDSLTFALPTHFRQQAQERVKALIKTWKGNTP